MRNVRVGIMGMAAWLALAALAAAQGQAPRPAIELGIAAGGIRTQTIDFDGAGLGSGMAQIQASVPLTDRFSLEGSLALAPGGQTCCHKTFEGFYTAQIRQRLTAGRDPGLFITYGLAGYLARESHGVLRVPQPDGSILEMAPYHHTIAEVPYVTLFGVGFDRPLASRVSARFDVQSMSVLWLPLGVRASAGVSFGFGHR